MLPHKSMTPLDSQVIPTLTWLAMLPKHFVICVTALLIKVDSKTLTHTPSLIRTGFVRKQEKRGVRRTGRCVCVVVVCGIPQVLAREVNGTLLRTSFKVRLFIPCSLLPRLENFSCSQIHAATSWIRIIVIIITVTNSIFILWQENAHPLLFQGMQGTCLTPFSKSPSTFGICNYKLCKDSVENSVLFRY